VNNKQLCILGMMLAVSVNVFAQNDFTYKGMNAKSIYDNVQFMPGADSNSQSLEEGIQNRGTKEENLLKLRASVTGIAKSMNVKFVQTDINVVLKFFSSEFKLNVVSSPEVRGNINFAFNDVDPITSFDSILASNGMNWYIDENIVYIFVQDPIRVFKLNYAKCEDIEGSISPLLEKNSKASIDKRLNAIIVKGSELELRKIAIVVKELDKVPLQVLVEVKMLEAQEGFTSGIGTDFSLSKNNGGSYAENTGHTSQSNQSYNATGLFVKVLGQDIESLVQAMQQDTNLNILARPKILALNHKKAEINTGQRLGYKTNITIPETGMIQESVEFLDVGTKLSFTPHISNNGDILMEIRPEVSEGTITDGIPNETSTQTETSVLVRDGQTILIGGLIRNKKQVVKTGIPILSSLPILDMIFGRTEITSQKVETVVLITPHLVK
jgi:type II secretory pathway component GspD/PulD (secretin)